AAAIVVSPCGWRMARILAGARAYFAMGRDGLFFPAAGRLNAHRVPAVGLLAQGVWAGLLVLPRIFDPVTGTYGNLYGSLLDYVVSAALVFYIATIRAVFMLRRRRPDGARHYRSLGSPIAP